MAKKKKDPTERPQIKAAKDNYAKKLNMTSDQVRSAYLKGAYGTSPNALKTNGGKPAAQKTRAKGSTTLTAYGKPVKKATPMMASIKKKKK